MYRQFYQLAIFTLSVILVAVLCGVMWLSTTKLFAVENVEVVQEATALIDSEMYNVDEAQKEIKENEHYYVELMEIIEGGVEWIESAE